MVRISIAAEFPEDRISRAAGETLRRRILALVESGEPLDVDFTGVVIGSTSFLDEGLAKLALEGWDRARLDGSVRLVGMNRNDHDRAVLDCLLDERFS